VKSSLPWLAAATALYAAAALFQLYPAWLDLDHGVVGDWMHPDMISNHWLYRWLPEELTGGGSIVHNSRYYHPIGDGPWLAGNGSDAVPYTLVALWMDWPGSATAWVAILIVLNGLSGFALSRAAGASAAAALVGGLFLAWCPYVAFELGCARFAQGPLYWFAFFLACWIRLLDRPSWGRAAAAGALYSACAFMYWYYGLWAALFGAVLWAFRPSVPALLRFLPFAVAGTVPFLAVFLSHWAGIPGTVDEGFPHVLAIESGLPVTFPLSSGTGALSTIVLPWLLTGFALAGLRRPWSALQRGLALAALLFYLLALGPHLLLPDGSDSGLPAPYLAAYGGVGLLRRFWWPYRHIAALTIALVPLAALGVERVLRAAGEFKPHAVAALVALLPMELSARAANLGVVTSWWEEPEAYAELAEREGDVLLELPLSSQITRSQQSLSYQWVHGKTLANGHAMWVERVRPDAWDDWIAGHPLLDALHRQELGEEVGTVELDAASFEALEADGLRLITVSAEFFPGKLGDLAELHAQTLTALFGEPVHEQDALQVWDVASWTGVDSVAFESFAVPSEYVTQEGGIDPHAASVHSLGWRPLNKDVPPVIPPEEAFAKETDAERDRRIQTLPPMVRRRIEREQGE